MENNRREFLKLAGMAGAGLIIGSGRAQSLGPSFKTHPQVFNMHAYAAPKLDKVRVGFIGAGSRGSGTIKRMARVEGVEIKAICDLVPARVAESIESIKEYGHSPESFTKNEEDWKRLCDRDDLDLIVISTPWSLHTPQAVYAMEQGKHAAVEVPAATTVEECWQLVKTSERTQKHCMMLANSAYGDFQLMTLNMARQGFFGEIIHGEGAYIHDRVNDSETRWVRDEENNNWFAYRPWRLEENSKRNGNLYPTHGLGTICQIMNLNYGDRMDYLVSTSSNDFSMGVKMKELAAKDDFYKPYVGKNFRGNMNVTTIRTERGRTIMVQHDISSPRPNIRFNLISGTKAIAQQYPSPAIAYNHDGWLSDAEYKDLQKTYQPEISKRVGQMAKNIGGHGGVDTLLVWRLVDCLRNGIPLDMDVYDAALWSCISPLSEWSVANRSNSIDVPDFTSGAYKTNQPGMDISLNHGGTIKFM